MRSTSTVPEVPKTAGQPEGRAPTPKRSGERLERALGAFAVATLLLAWLVGRSRAGTDIEPFLHEALPTAIRFEALPEGIYAGYSNDGDTAPVGFVAVGEATGYGGPLRVAVGVDPQGNIVQLATIDHKETPSFLLRVVVSRFPDSLVAKSFSDRFELGEDVDAVSGATYTARALADAVRAASRQVASRQLGLQVPPESPKPLQVGVPEIALVALYAIGYVGHQRNFRHKKLARWISMFAGLLLLGFLYNNPLTLANINSLLLGFWPDWRTHLYWYLLIGGIVFVFTIDNKNPYCEWFCPFGAAQECLGAIGGAKSRTPPRYRDALRWLQRGLAWAAILIALLYRNPGLSSYEIFGTLFDFAGSGRQFALLGIVLVVSLFLKRPWCAYLCPLRPVTDFIRLVRRWSQEGLQRWTRKRTQPV